MNKKEKLRNLLENVSDAYPDFVIGGMIVPDKYEEHTDEFIAFIEANPGATTSDIISYETEKIFGIKPLI